MKRKVGSIVAIVALLCVLGALVGLLWYQDTAVNASKQETEMVLPSASVAKGSIVDEVTGSGELKPGVNEKLKMAKWRYFKAFVAPLDVRVPAGTPLVEYTNGEFLVAPYDLVVASWDLPKDKFDELSEDHFVEVNRVDVIHMELDVHENDVSRLAVGQSVQVKLSSDESKVYEGTISKIAQVGSYEATGSNYKVTVEFQNDDAAMLGMSATAAIVVGEATDVLTVPVSAINDGPDGPYVLVKKQEDIMQIPVKTGLSDKTMVEVTGDIAVGDEVIVPQASGSDVGGTDAGMSGMAAPAISLSVG